MAPEGVRVHEKRGYLVLSIRNLRKTYGIGKKQTDALGDISFDIPEGELVSIVGPSGCGKTTLLKCMAGLLEPSSGEVLLNGVPVRDATDRTAVVFQEYSRSLFPWMTVRENVAFPLEGEKEITGAARKERVLEALDSVGLSDAMEKYPWQLSGGMQQRVSIARALAYKPVILLMDEPFASVDAQTRADLEDLTLQIQREHGMTIAVVTHDIDESIYLANHVVILGAAPTIVLDMLPVPLPRVRDQVATKELADFSRLRAQVHSYMKRHVKEADGVTLDQVETIGGC